MKVYRENNIIFKKRNSLSDIYNNLGKCDNNVLTVVNYKITPTLTMKYD